MITIIINTAIMNDNVTFWKEQVILHFISYVLEIVSNPIHEILIKCNLFKKVHTITSEIHTIDNVL